VVAVFFKPVSLETAVTLASPLRSLIVPLRVAVMVWALEGRQQRRKIDASPSRLMDRTIAQAILRVATGIPACRWSFYIFHGAVGQVGNQVGNLRAIGNRPEFYLL
jgi:hypothetical protein